MSQTEGTTASGEPVPGAEILIEQEPNDVPIQSALTNQDGDYILKNIPIGNQYHLVVDVPGYPMLTTFINISVGSNDTLLDNYNFILDTTSGGGIFMDTISGVTEHFIQSGFKSFEVYPNPLSEFMIVNFELSKENSISIELINELGETIKQVLNIADCKKGVYNYQINIP
ncbi:MAG: carboxypeptidase regulatory-like domain-containing protein [Bacteroidia bacterium]|nr:carboxypeptidase regulatory-like domain-containing protein [Bacteroidia bacterium]